MKEAAGNLLLTSLSHIKRRKTMTHFKILLTLLIGGIALLSEFVFHQPALHLRLSHLLEGFSPS